MTALSEDAHSAGAIPKKHDKDLKAISAHLNGATAILKTLEAETALKWVQGNLTQVVKKIEENLSFGS